MRGNHAVWEAWVNFERAVFEQLALQQRCVFVRHDFVIVTLHYQSRHRDRFQITRLVCLGEGLDAFVMSECAAHHPLTPPILDDSLRGLRAGSVETVKGTRRDIEKELRPVRSQRLAEAVEHFDWRTAGALLGLDHEGG